MLDVLLEESPVCFILTKKVHEYFKDTEHRKKFEEWYKKKALQA